MIRRAVTDRQWARSQAPKRQPRNEQAAVVAGAGEQSIDLIAVATFQEVPLRSPVLFDVTYNRLGRGPASMMIVLPRRAA